MMPPAVLSSTVSGRRSTLNSVGMMPEGCGAGLHWNGALDSAIALATSSSQALAGFIMPLMLSTCPCFHVILAPSSASVRIVCVWLPDIGYRLSMIETQAERDPD